MSEDYVVIEEGKARIKVPNPLKYLRPDMVYEPAWAPVFYNPAQTLNRDASVLVLSALLNTQSFEKPVRVADPFSGTGVRAVRYAIEVPSVDEVYANDLDPKAFELIRENVRINNVQDRVRVFRGDANAILYMLKSLGYSFVFVDIDPYGTPAPYVDAGVWSLRNNGVLAITATDTAPLSGSKYLAGSRRYDVKLLPNDIGVEVGLRVLLGYIARRGATRDRAITPLLSFYSGHYYRIFVKVSRGATKAGEVLSNQIRYLLICDKCGFRTFTSKVRGDEACSFCGSPIKFIGPLWGGELISNSFLKILKDMLGEFSYLQTRNKLVKLLEFLENEITGLPAYNLITLAKFLKTNIPPVKTVLDCLKRAGFKASRTHLAPQLIRTDADQEALLKCVSH
ncbi:MAG: tRNA (guanine(10)-N(2))-dimethyltransferase [Desulfurococcaceae archaeon TW002]